MKKYKERNKKKNKDSVNIEDLFNDININLSYLLFKESLIETKKKAGLKLSNEEFIMDSFLVKPSILVRLLRSINNDK